MRVLRLAGLGLLTLVWLVVAARLFTDLGALWLGGLLVAAAALAGLPLALALESHRPSLAPRCESALSERRTPAMLLGAAALLALVVLLGVASERGGAGPAGAVASIFYVWAVVGFSGSARATGTGLAPRGGRTRRLILGWLVRSAVLATPLVWPALLAYQLMTSFGAAATAWRIDAVSSVDDASSG